MKTGVLVSAEKLESYIYFTRIRIVHISIMEMKSMTTMDSVVSSQRILSGTTMRRMQFRMKPTTRAPEMRSRSTNDE